MMTRAQVRARMLAHPPRKIRRWVKQMGANYEPGYGWYVTRYGPVSPDDPVPPLPCGPSRILEMDPDWLRLRLPVILDSEGRLVEQPGRIPVEPPVDWPVSTNVRAVLAAQRLARLAERWEGVPNPPRDPAEDTLVTAVFAAFADLARVLARRYS
jgi:hypothetical protein